MSAMKISDLMGATARASADVMTSREDARLVAVKTIRDLEQKVIDAIAGDTIRGLCDLTPSPRGTGLQAVRVHATPRRGHDEPLDDRWVTIITKNGTLARARRTDSDPGWAVFPCGDVDIVAQDLEPYVRAVQHILERHISRAERTTSNYLRVTLLATKISNAIGFDF